MEKINNHYAARKENIIWNRLDDMVMVIFSENEKDRVFNLNKTAGLIWEQCDGTKTIQEIAQDVCTAYEIEQDAALEDTIVCINDFQAKNIITLTNAKNQST